jgi:L-threonylcarbamoyladenylate synthase
MIVYRPGAITLEQIREVAGPAEMFVEKEAAAAEPREAMPSPGVGLRHYAPKARLILVEAGDGTDRVDLALRLYLEAVAHSREGVGVMLPDGLPGEQSMVDLKDRLRFAETFRWGRWSEPEELARRLFLGLRELDAARCTVILCPVPPGRGIAEAIRDRLRKAAWPLAGER